MRESRSAPRSPSAGARERAHGPEGLRGLCREGGRLMTCGAAVDSRPGRVPDRSRANLPDRGVPGPGTPGALILRLGVMDWIGQAKTGRR